MSTYGISTTVDSPFADTVDAVRVALADQGFGVLSEIDVAATLKAKLDADLPPYLILGACNPPLAHRALDLDPSIGLLLPCNVVVRAIDDGTTLVEAADPQMMVQVTGDERMASVADDAAQRLRAALQNVNTSS